MEQKTRRKRAYSLVKSIFRAESEIRMAVIEAKTAERKGFGGGGGQAYKSDPTADKATRQLSEVQAVRVGEWLIRKPEEWLKVISLTYSNTKDAERELMRRYYAGESISEMAKGDCGYEEPTLYVIARNFQQLGVEIACQMGLLKVV